MPCLSIICDKISFSEATHRFHSVSERLLPTKPCASKAFFRDTLVSSPRLLFVVNGIKSSLQDDVVTLQFENTKMLNPDLLQMMYSWAEQAEKYNAGEISKEEYDKWRYNYPAFANLKGYTKVPSKALSDMMIDALKKQS
jgi:hypothetical protein